MRLQQMNGRPTARNKIAAALAACAELAVALTLAFCAVSGASQVLIVWCGIPIPRIVICVAYLLGLAISFWYFQRRFNYYIEKWVVR